MNKKQIILNSKLAAVISFPFKHLADSSNLGGKLLLSALIVALWWANSPWQASYSAFWHETQLGLIVGSTIAQMNLLHFINDGLMAIFFFTVGLEIKRELIAGELSQREQAMFPVVAAAGGMLAPAIIYMLWQINDGITRGWAIPTATDIAFALGILMLLGSRASTSLKVFLTALAIVDDIGAIILISLFYSAPPVLPALIVAACILLIMLAMNVLNVRIIWPYILLSLVVWLLFLSSGIHATIAGVLAALTIPVKAILNKEDVAVASSNLANRLQKFVHSPQPPLADKGYLRHLQRLSQLSRAGTAPLQLLETRLHSLVSYFILPLFALANGGIAISADSWSALLQPLSLGIIFGLLIGKPLGITTVCCLLQHLKIIKRPDDLTFRQLLAGGFFAGIGFTMSIFIASLAFSADSTLLSQAKLAVLISSLLASITGTMLLLTSNKKEA